MKQLQLNTFLQYSYLSDLKLSPDKNQMSFIKTLANYDANNYGHNLFLSDGKDHTQILNLKEDSRYIWENDENILFFGSDSEADKKLKELKYTLVYRYNLKSQKTKLAYQFKIPVSKIEILNSENLLITSSLSVLDHQLLENDTTRQNYLNEIIKDANYHIIDEVPFQFNGLGFIDNKRSQAFIYNIKEASYTPLVDKDVNFSSFELSENKEVIYFTSSVALGTPNFYDDLSKYTIDSKLKETIYNKNKLNISKIIPLKDEVYVLADDKLSHGINQNPDFYKLVNNDLQKTLVFGKSSNNSIGSDARFGSYAGSQIHEGAFYFLGTLNDRSCIYKFDGETNNPIFSPLGSIDTFVYYKEDLYLIGLFENMPQELYKANVKRNRVKAITDYNIEVLKDTYLATPILHQFENDNQKLDGWVLLPQDYDKKQKYPAILDIHGGPKTIYSDVFYHEMQAWVNKGYIVFYTNPRGGDAYGDDFANIRGKYGTIDYDDIMAFTDLVIQEYSIDETRLGVTGGSYGGFMTNWIVSHTDRFKVAATQRSISNWISFYGTSDIGSYFAPDQTGGHPLLDHDKVWEQSPLKHANNIKTPLLFIHSDQDYRCPIEQAMQLYTVIKMNGVDTKLVWFNGENHDLSRSGKPQARLKRLEEITTWIDKYLNK